MIEIMLGGVVCVQGGLTCFGCFLVDPRVIKNVWGVLSMYCGQSLGG